MDVFILQVQISSLFRVNATFPSPFHTLSSSHAHLGIPDIPCRFQNLHLLVPLSIVHLNRIHLRVVQPLQRLHHPRLAVPVGPPLLDRNEREVRLECVQIIRRHIPDQVRAFFVLVPHPVSIVDHVLGKVPLLEAAPDLVIVADAPSCGGGDEDRPVVKSVFARRTQASGELGDPNWEVAWRDLDQSVPFVDNFILGFRRWCKARREGCREGT